MSDPVVPGEVDLDTSALSPAPAAEPVVAEPVVPAEPVVAAEPVVPAEPAAVAVVPEPEKPAKPGMLEELIEHRTMRRNLEKQLEKLQPVLARLTPEMQEAITDGRVAVQPKATTADARKTQLASVAEELRLMRDDGTGKLVPDLEAAERVDKVIRERALEAARPAHEAVQQIQSMSLQQRAQANVSEAVRAATASKYAPEVVAHIKEQFEAAAAQNPGFVAQTEVAMQLWDSTIGRLVREGKIAPAATPAPTPAPTPTPAVVPSEAAGRRGPASAVINLSPVLQKVYRDNGLDPTKPSAPLQADRTGAIALE